MLFLLEEYRCKGYGKAMIYYWETLMRQYGYTLVMTSTLSNETAQHFYRKFRRIIASGGSFRNNFYKTAYFLASLFPKQHIILKTII